jgi:O-6-methylguanine DNA methyltransferase
VLQAHLLPLLFHSRLTRRDLSLSLYSTERGLVAIGLGTKGEEGEASLSSWIARWFRGVPIDPAGDRHRRVEAELAEYLEGRRRVFDLSLDLRGSDFQKTVWRAVENIPYGQTASYGEIAHLIGKPGASRAVGAANGANPLPIVIPCHRVIGSDGSLTGYGGGLPLKSRLLALEGVLESPAVQMRLF